VNIKKHITRVNNKSSWELQRINQIIISMLAINAYQLAAPNLAEWYNYVDNVQQYINSIPTHNTVTTSLTSDWYSWLVPTNKRISEKKIQELAKFLKETSLCFKKSVMNYDSKQNKLLLKFRKKAKHIIIKKDTNMYKVNDLILLKEHKMEMI